MRQHGTQLRVHPGYDIRLIRSRLGYRPDTTEIDSSALAAMHALVERTAARHPATVAWRIEPVSEIIASGDERPPGVRLACGAFLQGSRLAEWMEGCTELFLMFSTLGEAVQTAIRGATEAGRLSDAVVIDAAASEIVDAGLDWLMQGARRELMRENRMLTARRYSPGYGDMPLAEQGKLAELLEIERFGVQLTESFLLIPEKSVLAIAGIRVGNVSAGSERESTGHA